MVNRQRRDESKSMGQNKHKYPLLVSLAEYSRLKWRWIIVSITIALLLFLLLIIIIPGDSDPGRHTLIFWLNALRGPVLIVYILVLYPPLWHLYIKATDTLKQLLVIKENSVSGLMTKAFTFDRRIEWAGMFAGMGLYLVLIQPWKGDSGDVWFIAYMAVTHIIMFSLLGGLIYFTLASIRRFSLLGSQRLNIDIFNTEALSPLARWSFLISFAWMGGITLSVVFQYPETLVLWFNIVIYGFLLLVALLVFFLSLWNVHSVMAGIKRQELRTVRINLAKVYNEMKVTLSKNGLKGIDSLSSTITSLEAYKRMIQEVPEWPLNMSIMKRLLASGVAPVAVYIVRFLTSSGT